MRHLNLVPVLRAQLLHGIFGQAGFALFQNIRSHHIQRGDQVFAVQRHLHPRLDFKPFGAANMAIFAHINHGLFIGIDAEAAQF